jgi:hypothetical protein
MDGPRAVNLVLGRIAFHASRDSSWLLDERFEGLIDSPEERQLAQQFRRLYQQMPLRPETKWSPLAKRMEELGVTSGGQGSYR